MITRILIALAIAFGVIAAPTVSASVIDSYEFVGQDEAEWAEFHADAYYEYADEFTALFNSYETKRASNGRLMIRKANMHHGFRFAKMG